MGVTVTWEMFMGAGPAWTDVSTNTIVFSGSGTDISAFVTVGQYQDGTHVGTNDPGTDQCGANHANNVKYISGTEMSVNGGGTENINDTNLAQDECSLRLKVDCTPNYAIQKPLFYAYDGATATNYAVGVDVWGFERGVSKSAWDKLNDASATYGGNNAGERMILAAKPSAAQHLWYLALSTSPESAGAKGDFGFGFDFQYY